MPLIYLSQYRMATNAAAVITGSDTYFNNVVLLMHMDGANNGTTFTDVKGAPITRTGTPVTSTGTHKFGTAAGLFNGTSDYLTTPVYPEYGMGTGDFTIEGWFYTTDAGAQQALIDLRQPGVSTQVKPYMYLYQGNIRFLQNENILAVTPFPTSTWNHVAWSRSGGTSRFFLNGTLVGSVADTNDYGTANDVVIGQVGDNRTFAGYFKGYIDDVRITKGVSRYTAAFTAPTAAFGDTGPGWYDAYYNNVVLMMHMDGANNGTVFPEVKGATITRVGSPVTSTSKYKFGGASASFNGTTDYLVTPVSSSYGLGTNDFTIEGWFACTSYTKGSAAIVDFRSSGAATQTKPVIMVSSSKLVFYVGTSVLGQTTMTDNNWHHFAWSRSGGTSRVFMDGVLVASVADTNNYGASNDIMIGQVGDARTANGWFPGFIDDIRVTNGVGRYTAAFAPSINAFPNAASISPLDYTGTSYDPWYDSVTLLMHADGTTGTQTYNDVKGHTFSNWYGPSLSSTRSKFGSTSLYFYDYHGGNLNTTTTTQEFNVTNDFTAETWLNFNLFQTGGVETEIFGWYGTTNSAYGDTNSWVFANLSLYFWGTSGELGVKAMSTASGGNQFYPCSWKHNLVVNRWYHVAMVKSGSTITVYIDGQPVMSGALQYALNNEAANLRIGGGYEEVYYDEIRYTSNVARYTESFAVPSTAFAELTPPDDSMSNVVFMSHFDTYNGATVIRDRSGNATSVNITGTPTLSTVNKKFGMSSLKMASGDAVSVPYSPNMVMPGEWTVEGWIYPTAYPSGSDGLLFMKVRTASYPAYGFWFKPAGYLQAVFGNGYNGSTGGLITGNTGNIPLNTWTHIVQQRRMAANGQMYSEVFVNGQVVMTVNATAYQFDGNMESVFSIAAGFTGYIDDVRVTKGAARYRSGAFIPANQPVSNTSPDTDPYGSNVRLLMHGETLVDVRNNTMTATGTVAVSSAVSKFGTKSLYFPGGAILKTAANTCSTGYNDFTAECWVYPTTTPPSNGMTIMSWKAAAGTANTGAIGFNAAGNLEWGTTAGSLVSSTPLLTQNTWQHVAISRRGSQMFLFYNGNMVATGTDTNVFTSPNGFALGGRTDNNTTTSFIGYMNEVRLTVGTARYVGPFTPPTAAFDDKFKATKLLMHMENYLVDNMGHQITTAGTPTLSTARSKFGTSSVLLAGTDRIYVDQTDGAMCPGASDFTIEGWFYMANANGVSDYNQSIFQLSSGGYFQTTVSNSVALIFQNGYAEMFAGNVSTKSWTVPQILNTWRHFAVERYNGITTAYLDGVAILSVADTTVYTAKHLGFNGSWSTNSGLNGGNLDELRVTIGNARYKGAFTAPTAPFDPSK